MPGSACGDNRSPGFYAFRVYFGNDGLLKEIDAQYQTRQTLLVNENALATFQRAGSDANFTADVDECRARSNSQT